MLKRSKIIIIDGYNVLRNSARYAQLVGEAPDFRDWTSEVWNAAREALLNDVLKNLDKADQAIIVYDAAKRTHADADLPSQKPLKNCQVIFTDFGETADARIQKLAFASREKGLEVQVVTSDLAIQDATMNKGVVRTSSREFVANVTETENVEAPSSASPLNNSIKPDKQGSYMRTKVEDYVDAETAAKLRHLRDSL